MAAIGINQSGPADTPGLSHERQVFPAKARAAGTYYQPRACAGADTAAKANARRDTPELSRLVPETGYTAGEYTGAAAADDTAGPGDMRKQLEANS